MKHPSRSLAAVALVLTGGVLAAQTSRSDAVAPRVHAASARAVPLAAATLTCPAPAATGTTSSVVTAVAPGARTTPARGQLFLRQLLGRNRLQGDALPGGGRTVLVTSRGELLHAVVPTRTGPVIARGTGALAPGLSAGQFSRATMGADRGIGLAECTAPGTDAWFVGGGAGTGRSSTLYLSNPDTAPAAVDVLVWGPDGRLGSRSLQGVVLGPSSQRVLRLDAEVPALRYGVHVVARAGRVAAALRDGQSEGLQRLGWDWVAPVAAPATRQVVPGILGGSGSRTLRILAPGDTGAVVQVAVLGTRGTTRPAALAAIAVAAGTVAEVDVSQAAGRGPAGLLLTSDQPVTASVLVRQGALAGSGTAPADLAYATAVAPAAAGASVVLPYLATGVGRFAELAVSAPQGAGHLRLVPLDRAGRPVGGSVGGGSGAIDVPAGGSVSVELATSVGTYAYALLVEVLPGSGPVWSAGILREAGATGPLITELALHPQPYSVRVPAVAPDPARQVGAQSPASP